MLLFIPVLIFFVYRWTVDLYGVLAGCVACALVAFSPNLLAHAGLATVDFALAALLTAAAYTAWRWCQAPSARRAAVAGCIAGFAVGSKYSALAYLPVFLTGFFLLSRWHGRAHTNPGGTGAVRAGASQLLLFSASALLALWACFGFEARPLRYPSRRPYATDGSRRTTRLGVEPDVVLGGGGGSDPVARCRYRRLVGRRPCPAGA